MEFFFIGVLVGAFGVIAGVLLVPMIENFVFDLISGERK
jgi:uncharacterized protein YqgC (DUF456 family)